LQPSPERSGIVRSRTGGASLSGEQAPSGLDGPSGRLRLVEFRVSSGRVERPRIHYIFSVNQGYNRAQDHFNIISCLEMRGAGQPAAIEELLKLHPQLKADRLAHQEQSNSEELIREAES